MLAKSVAEVARIRAVLLENPNSGEFGYRNTANCGTN
jgi:hypothetical protein